MNKAVSAKPAECRAICVLGMHRSGTSLVTNLVAELGAYVGEPKELIQPSEVNPKGFWERLDILRLQEAMLGLLGRRWDTSRPLPPRWLEDTRLQPLEQDLYELVSTKYKQWKLWTWKDPRTCLLLPVWKRVLARAQIQVQYICIVRNPGDVAKSLNKRDGFPIDKSLGIWLNYNASLLSYTMGERRIFLDYDALLDEPDEQIARISRFVLGNKQAVLSSRRSLRDVVNPALARSRIVPNASVALDVPARVRELYEAMRKACSADSVPEELLKAITESISQEHVEYSRLMCGETEAHLAKLRAQEILHLHDLISQKDCLIVESAKLVATKDEHLAFANKMISDLREALTQKENILQSRYEELNGAMERIANLEQRLAKYAPIERLLLFLKSRKL